MTIEFQQLVDLGRRRGLQRSGERRDSPRVSKDREKSKCPAETQTSGSEPQFGPMREDGEKQHESAIRQGCPQFAAVPANTFRQECVEAFVHAREFIIRW